MRNIWRIFRDDVARTTSNAIGLLVLVGLVVVPSLYAWFNIAGSWDPYSSTDGLKVAVASNDVGYESDLIPMEVNIGSTVVASLHENDDFDWVFTDETDAVDGVGSGAYYAAIVIPESFSADMMTLFSPDVQHAAITYYTNEKENPIAPHVTDKGADAIQKQIDETFVSTVDEAGLKTVVNLIDFMGSDSVGNYAVLLSNSLDASIGDVDEASRQATAFASLVGATASLTDSTSSVLSKSGSTSTTTQDAFAQTQEGIGSAREALDGAAAAVNQAIRESASGFDGVAAGVDTAFGAVQGNAGDAAGGLNEAAAEVTELIVAYTSVRDALVEVAASVPESPDAPTEPDKPVDPDKPSKPDKPTDPDVPSDPNKPTQPDTPRTAAASSPDTSGIDSVVAHMDKTIALLRSLQQSLGEAAQRVGSASGDMEQDRKEIQSLIAQAKAGIENMDTGAEGSLSCQLGSLAETLGSVGSSAVGVSDGLKAAASNLGAASGSLSSQLADVRCELSQAAEKLSHSAAELRSVKNEVDVAVATGDMERVRQIIGSDPQSMAELLAAPVQLDRQTVFPIENNGSSMAAFYTILSIWVGSTILAAMMRTNVSERRLRDMTDVKPYQLYLGRFGLFAVLALLQSTLVCLGDLYFLGIQCEHPLLFMLTGWAAGLVFCNLIYTLTVSFGDVGKAIAVVLLVMQVAGSGGTFPIEMTSSFFQSVYPFLPFTHGIDAMHACIGGIYGNEYWVALGKLALFLVPSLLLGLVLRKPVIRLNTFVTEKLEETKLM